MLHYVELKHCLIEKSDFASGTSSRSTKLIHGGLRYLKQLELKLVKDVGSERAIVYNNALHIVRPEKMLLPIIKNGSLGKNSSSLGLLVYDILAGVKKKERRKMLSKEETLNHEKLLNESKLTGGGLYYEYRTDDARLVIELAKSAIQEGSTCLNYAKAESFIYNSDGLISGANIVDAITGNAFNVKAKTVVNACGPGVDLIRKSDQSLFGKRLQLTKGCSYCFSLREDATSTSGLF
jgi:glycerol-3-phosphate dehydrogenase